MSLLSLDLDVENYSIREIKRLFKLQDEYSVEQLHGQVDKFLASVNENEELTMGEKKKVVNFLNSLRVIMIRHLNNGEGMYNELDKVQNIELPNPIIANKSADKHGPENVIIEGGRGAEIISKQHGEEDDTGDFRMIKYKKDGTLGIGLNPLKTETITKCITIDTRFRDNYSTTMSTDFKCNLSEKLTKVVSMQLTALEIPTSYLVFSEATHNNYFSYQVIESGNVSTVKTIKVPSGNYSHSELLTIINNLISANDDSIKVEVDVSSLGSGTGKTMITNEEGQLVNLFFDRDENGVVDNVAIPLKFGWILGFRNNQYSGNKEYVSEGMYEDHGSRYMYLCINDHNNNTHDTYISMFNDSTFNRNILARISIKTPAFHILNETGLHLVTEPRKYMGPVNISTMNIQLLDEFGRIINLNNMDYSFCLSIESLYR
jgi:hypothetical protein